MATIWVLPWEFHGKIKEYEVTDEQYEDIKNILHHAQELYRLGLKYGLAQYDEDLTDKGPYEDQVYDLGQLIGVLGELGSGFNGYFLKRMLRIRMEE